MNKITFSVIFGISLFFSIQANAQVNEEQTGAWYMYFFNTTFKESGFGVQGDVQYRNWNIIGDLEQLLIRGGLTYNPETIIGKYSLGYAHITTGTFGDNPGTSAESRIYQEALLPHKLSERLLLSHRFRYEQRWVEGQDFRTRFRYNIALNVPLNQPNLNKKAIYLALYNEIFINGERQIGNGRTVEFFDRNRFYSGLGYGLADSARLQLGYMNQTINSYNKGQLQISLHHTF